MPRFCFTLRMVIVLAVFFSTAVSSTTWANEKAMAKKHFENGLAMMEMEDFGGAAVEFEASVGILPTKSALFNLAMCYKALHRYPDALKAFRRMIRDFNDAMDKEMKGEVRKNIAAISKMIGEIEVHTNLPGATVLLDGNKVGTTPLASPLEVGAGEHRVRVSLKDHLDEEKTVVVVSGSKAVVRLSLSPAASPPADGTTPSDTPEPESNADMLPVEETEKQTAEEDPDLVAMETALNRNLARDYKRYKRSHLRHKQSFIEYEYNLARKKRNRGIVNLCVLTPLFAGAGLTGFLVMKSKSDSLWGEDDVTAQAWETLSYMALIAGVGSGVAFGIVGTVRWVKGHGKMKRIKPLLTAASNRPRLRLTGVTPWLSPADSGFGAACTFSF